jgi:hypothetical protein
VEHSLALALHASRQVICAVLALVMSSQTRAPIVADSELDFWVGYWNVYVDGRIAGHDLVTKSLNGFAITEQWQGTEKADVGMSLFYYMPAKKQWTQVWVTAVGAYKEKYSEPVVGGVRFTGTAILPRGKTIPDRTTLTRLAGGNVRQVIEESIDGKTWSVGFGAIYRHS